jgi:hypothetical protein
VDFVDVGGEKEASQLPFQGITASIALETAAELTNIDIEPIIRRIEKALVRELRIELELANEHYTDERILKIVGPNDQPLIKKFNSLDLKHQTDLTVSLETALGLSKAAQQQKLVDLWDRRIITDPSKFMKAFVTGDVNMVLEEEEPTRNVVVEQINMIKEGAQPVVLPTDNHIVHITMLTDFMNTPEFRRLAPDRQQLALATLQQHISFVQPQQAEGAQNQAAVGTPFGSQVPEGAV